MEYNKKLFQKAKDKKVLHKVGKQWVVLSLATLMSLGFGTLATHVSVHADVNNKSNGGRTDILRQRLNTNLQKTSSFSNRRVNQSAFHTYNGNSRQNDQTSQIAQAADVLHNRIIANASVGLADNGNNQQTKNNVNTEGTPQTNSVSIHKSLKPVNDVKIGSQESKVGASENFSLTSDHLNHADYSDFVNHYESNMRNIGSGNWNTASVTYYSDGYHGNNAGDVMVVSGGSINSKDVPNFLSKSINSNRWHIIFDSKRPVTLGNSGSGNNVISFFSGNNEGLYNDVESFDLSGFKLDSYSDVSNMFWNDSVLRSVGLNHLDLSKVSNMSGMFQSDQMLSDSIDLSGMKLPSVTNMTGMFKNDQEIKKVDLSNVQLNTRPNSLNINDLFQDDENLQSVSFKSDDLSGINNTSDVFLDGDYDNYDFRGYLSDSVNSSSADPIASLDLSHIKINGKLGRQQGTYYYNKAPKNVLGAMITQPHSTVKDVNLSDADVDGADCLTCSEVFRC